MGAAPGGIGTCLPCQIHTQRSLQQLRFFPRSNRLSLRLLRALALDSLFAQAALPLLPLALPSCLCHTPCVQPQQTLRSQETPRGFSDFFPNESLDSFAALAIGVD